MVCGLLVGGWVSFGELEGFFSESYTEDTEDHRGLGGRLVSCVVVCEGVVFVFLIDLSTDYTDLHR